MVSHTAARGAHVLLLAGERACAVPVAQVAETMRPLAVRAIAGVPPFVSGLSLIRGEPTPVVDLGRLLGVEEGAPITRFLTLRLGGRPVALAVAAVVGVRRLDELALAPMPPLLGHVAADLVEAVGALDARLLVVLRAARVVPEPVWPTLADAGTAS